ncbi:hypothetical protein [Burkholderia stagnalis]
MAKSIVPHGSRRAPHANLHTLGVATSAPLNLRAIATRLLIVPAAALAVALTACGGGGDGDAPNPSSSATNPPQGATQNSANWTAVGMAPAVTGANGAVAVVFAPDTLSSTGLSGTAISAASTPLANQVQQPNDGGAFTTISAGTASVSLTKGSTIADINGAGGYIAIGRWTHGSDSSGGSYTANQGAHYAIGTPLTLSPGTGSLSCSNVMATSPASTLGNVAPGTLVSASASLDLASLTLKNFVANVKIGADTGGVITVASVPTGGEAFGGGTSFLARTMGSDSSKPLVAIAYGAKLPNTGDINGLVVLSCHS